MREVPRHELVPEAVGHAAYENRPLPIGHGHPLRPTLEGAAQTTLTIEQHGRLLHGQWLPAWGRVGEVEPAALAQIALLVAHPPVLNVPVAPTALAAQPHGQPP